MPEGLGKRDVQLRPGFAGAQGHQLFLDAKAGRRRTSAPSQELILLTDVTED